MATDQKNLSRPLLFQLRHPENHRRQINKSSHILEGFSELFPLTLTNLPQQQHVMNYWKKTVFLVDTTRAALNTDRQCTLTMLMINIEDLQPRSWKKR